MFQTRKQVSAGGIVFRKNSNSFEVALISRRQGTIWCLPKGIVEKNESMEDTARREVKEETGLEGELLAKINSIHYFYNVKEEMVRFSKTVDFYLFRYKSGDTRDHDDEVDEVRWFDVDEAISKLNYKSEIETMEKAKVLLAGM